MKYVSLHHHTTFSNGDGHSSPDAHFKRAEELGMTALAMTEHGNVSSHAAAEIAAKKYGLKFIPGLEAYSSPPGQKRKCHQTILAEDVAGYCNLNELVTQSYRDFYQWPTVTWDNLKRNNKGLIVTSGCASGLVACKLLGGKWFGDERDDYNDEQFDSALKVIRMYQRVFGDRYFLEVQRFPQLDRICKLNQALEQISGLLGIPLLATADVHYCYSDESEIQQALHAAHRGSDMEKIGEDWEYDIPLTLPESDSQIFKDLRASGLSRDGSISAIENTAMLAEHINFQLPRSRPLRYPIPEMAGRTNPLSASEFMDEMIAAGIDYRNAYGKKCDGPEYQERIDYELSVIKLRPEFIDYFLFLHDLIVWAKEHGIVVGPGRGSAAASLVCYLLRITEVDPMTVPTMVFERFMDPSRTDLPDIDIDIADEDRWRLVEYLREKYGKDHVGNVANIIRYRGKSTLDKLGIIYRIPNNILKPIKERISDRTETDDRVDDSLLDALERYGDDPDVQLALSRCPAIATVGTAIEGDVRTFGTHAAGYVVSSEPITDTCALYERTVGSGAQAKKSITIPYDKRDAEYLGMMKADLLGLSTCGMLSHAIEFINETGGIKW